MPIKNESPWSFIPIKIENCGKVYIDKGFASVYNVSVLLHIVHFLKICERGE